MMNEMVVRNMYSSTNKYGKCILLVCLYNWLRCAVHKMSNFVLIIEYLKKCTRQHFHLYFVTEVLLYIVRAVCVCLCVECGFAVTRLGPGSVLNFDSSLIPSDHSPYTHTTYLQNAKSLWIIHPQQFWISQSDIRPHCCVQVMAKL